MNIRPAVCGDISALNALYTDFFAHNATQQPQWYHAVEETGAYPRSVLESQCGDILVAETDDVIVGFVHIEENATPPYPSVRAYRYACVVDIAVSERYRRKGIGRLLLEECKRWARLRRLDYIELTVLENNAAGIRFYEREHFTTVSRTMRLRV